jgi:hypothetical protein
MGDMPALISSSEGSCCGIREKLGSLKWPFVSKNDRNISRSWFRPKLGI